MSQVKLNLRDMKPEALSATGGQVYGLDEYIYIKSFEYDDNNKIKVSYYVLLKTGEDTFDLIPSVNKPYFEYNISDGKPFTDVNGDLVYSKDAEGNIIFQDVEVPTYDENEDAILDAEGNPVIEIVSQPLKRLDDFTRNFTAFASLIIPSIFADIINHRGYHANGGGAIDNPIV